MSGLSIQEMALLVVLISLFGGITTGNLVALFYRHKKKQDKRNDK